VTTHAQITRNTKPQVRSSRGFLLTKALTRKSRHSREPQNRRPENHAVITRILHRLNHIPHPSYKRGGCEAARPEHHPHTTQTFTASAPSRPPSTPAPPRRRNNTFRSATNEGITTMTTHRVDLTQDDLDACERVAMEIEANRQPNLPPYVTGENCDSAGAVCPSGNSSASTVGPCARAALTPTTMANTASVAALAVRSSAVAAVCKFGRRPRNCGNVGTAGRRSGLPSTPTPR
jgi:hypothetical protein